VTLLQKTKALIQLIRPELPAAAGVCVVVGQAVALGKLPPLSSMGLGFLLGLFLSSSAMIFNDYFDLEVDRVNAPQRPIPSGLLTQPEVITFGCLTAAIALIIAVYIHPLAFLLSLITWVLGFLYNWKLKAAGLWGNLIVASSVGMTFLIGGISVGQVANPMVWIFSLIAFLLDLGEEIAGDAMDMEGDRKRGSRSIAIVHGKMVALRISSAFFASVILLTGIPVLLGETSPAYWVPITVMDGLVLFFTMKLYRSRSPQAGRESMRGLYLSASLGLVAFLLARFFQ
jgi:geranylgeranylglycerol-phosphate geranylgeranyltransferase